MQQTQVLLRADPLAVSLDQPIEGQAEPAGREQILAVPVVRECARLANQRVDDVPVLHRVLVTTHQPRQRVGEPVRVPDFNAVGEQPGLDRLADQPTVNRVRVAIDVNQTAGIDPAPQAQAAVDAERRQRTQGRQLLVEAFPATAVASGHQRMEELHVLTSAGEVATTPHQEGLINGRLEVTVGRFVVAVLVGLTHVDPLAGQTIVFEQVPVAGVELPLGREVVDRRRQTVAAMALGCPAEFP